MTWAYWLLSFQVFTCPGGLLGGFVESKVPPALKPIVCAGHIKTERFTSKDLAHRRYREVGGTIEWCQKLKCSERKVTTRTTVEIE